MELVKCLAKLKQIIMEITGACQVCNTLLVRPAVAKQQGCSICLSHARPRGTLGKCPQEKGLFGLFGCNNKNASK